MDEIVIGKPSGLDQAKIKAAYIELLSGTPFEKLKLDQFQQMCLLQYTKTTSGDRYGAHVAAELGWPVTFCCELRKVRKTVRRVVKELQTAGPAGRDRILKRYHILVPIVPAYEPRSLSDAFKLKYKGLGVAELKQSGVTDSQVRKMRKVVKGLEAGKTFAQVAIEASTGEVQVKLIAKILKESKQVKAV